MKTLAAAVLLFAALPALAAEGFFRHQESPPHEYGEQGDEAAAAQCTLVIRYNSQNLASQEITYEGPQALCLSNYEAAMAQAVAAKIGGRDPFAPGRPYDCGIVITFAPGVPAAGLPSPPVISAISLVGGPACSATKASALAIAQQNMTCVFECRFGH